MENENNCISFLNCISTSYRKVPSAIWQIFSEFLILRDLFYVALGEWNKGKIWKMSKVFANIERG